MFGIKVENLTWLRATIKRDFKEKHGASPMKKTRKRKASNGNELDG